MENSHTMHYEIALCLIYEIMQNELLSYSPNKHMSSDTIQDGVKKKTHEKLKALFIYSNFFLCSVVFICVIASNLVIFRKYS